MTTKQRVLQAILGAGLVAGGVVLGVQWERARTHAAAEAEAEAEKVKREEAAAQSKSAQPEEAQQAKETQQAKAPRATARKSVLSGPNHSCNICGYAGRFAPVSGRPEASCPRCRSRERHRLLMYFLEHETPLFREKLEVLQFSPMKGEADRLRKLTNLKYVTAEYEAGKADLQLDLTALAQPDASWDVLIVYHILEHIIDDRKAIAEMFRVLRPGGMAILQVPLEVGRTEMHEDPSIVDPKERARQFGQWDHVRQYSAAGLRSRLEEAGFVVEKVNYLGKLDPATIETFSMTLKDSREFDEDIWVARKPIAAPKTARGTKK